MAGTCDYGIKDTLYIANSMHCNAHAQPESISESFSSNLSLHHNSGCKGPPLRPDFCSWPRLDASVKSFFAIQTMDLYVAKACCPRSNDHSLWIASGLNTTGRHTAIMKVVFSDRPWAQRFLWLSWTTWTSLFLITQICEAMMQPILRLWDTTK